MTILLPVQAVDGEIGGFQLPAYSLPSGATLSVCLTVRTDGCGAPPARTYSQCTDVRTASPPSGGTFDTGVAAATELATQVDFQADGWGDDIILHQLGVHLQLHGQLAFVPLTSFRPSLYTEFTAALPIDAANVVLRAINIWGAWTDVPLPRAPAISKLKRGVLERLEAWRSGGAGGGEYLSSALLVAATDDTLQGDERAPLLVAQEGLLEQLLTSSMGAESGRAYHVSQVCRRLLLARARMPTSKFRFDCDTGIGSQVESARSLLALLAFTVTEGNVSRAYVDTAAETATNQLAAISEGGLVPHGVSFAAVALLSAADAARIADHGLRPPQRRLLQAETPAAAFAAASRAVDAVLLAELEQGGALGVSRSERFDDLEVHYASLQSVLLHGAGAQCGYFDLPAGTGGADDELRQCISKTYPRMRTGFVPGNENLVTGAHELTVYTGGQPAELTLPVGSAILAHMTRVPPLPEDPAEASFCIALEGGQWERTSDSGIGEPPAKAYTCPLASTGIAAVEDSQIVRITRGAGDRLEWLFIALIVLLVVLVLIIVALAVHHRLQALRVNRHEQRIKNAELGVLLEPQAIGDGDTHVNVAGDVRTTPNLLHLEEPM